MANRRARSSVSRSSSSAPFAAACHSSSSAHPPSKKSCGRTDMGERAAAVLNDRNPVAATTAEDWKNTILAGLANYIDAGSIVSGSAALALWAVAYDLSPSFIGLLGAFSANAISAGVGALVGGRLCDIFGRKRIYQYDMLFYAFGMLWLVFAMAP